MRVLALDTTTRAGSVALVDNDAVIDVRRGDESRTHAERLPAEITALLERHGATLADVDVFAIASGPGSFTGLRIGIATIQGLAFALGRPVVAISALDALAHAAAAAARAGDLVAPWMDAYRREVFAALFRVTDAPALTPGRIIEIEGPTVGDPAATLDRWQASCSGVRVWWTGEGAAIYRQAIVGAGTSEEYVLPAPLLAGTVGRLAVVEAAAGRAISPAAIQPLYVRRPDAELARDRVGR